MQFKIWFICTPLLIHWICIANTQSYAYDNIFAFHYIYCQKSPKIRKCSGTSCVSDLNFFKEGINICQQTDGKTDKHRFHLLNSYKPRPKMSGNKCLNLIYIYVYIYIFLFFFFKTDNSLCCIGFKSRRVGGEGRCNVQEQEQNTPASTRRLNNLIQAFHFIGVFLCLLPDVSPISTVCLFTHQFYPPRGKFLMNLTCCQVLFISLISTCTFQSCVVQCNIVK